jgi:hypothetical protein
MPDVNNLDLLGENVEVSGDASSEDFFTIKLPDDGKHTAVLHLGDKGVKADRQRNKTNGAKDGAAYLNVHLQARILNEDGSEGSSVFDTPTSIVMQSTKTSKLHAVLDLAGNPAPNECNLGQLKEHTELALAQSPKVVIETQWEASVNDGTKDKPNYRIIVNGQKKFPPVLDADGNPTGKYQQEITDPKSGQVVNAQVRVRRYFRAC